jgi:hypothetical protein
MPNPSDFSAATKPQAWHAAGLSTMRAPARCSVNGLREERIDMETAMRPLAVFIVTAALALSGAAFAQSGGGSAAGGAGGGNGGAGMAPPMQNAPTNPDTGMDNEGADNGAPADQQTGELPQMNPDQQPAPDQRYQLNQPNNDAGTPNMPGHSE